MTIFRVISCNLNGIRAAARKGFFTWVQEQRPDIICLQELKAQAQDFIASPCLQNLLPGYQFFASYAQHKGYSGVAMFSLHNPINISRQLGWSNADIEGRYLQLDFHGISIVSLYLPSGSSGAKRQSIKFAFLDYYKQHLSKQVKLPRELLICGDWNIAHTCADLKNWRANQQHSGFLPTERAWLDSLFSELSLLDAFRIINQQPEQYTWWSYRSPQAWHKNIGWRIDYQIITPGLRSAVLAANIYKEQRFSDHAPLIIDYNLQQIVL